MDGQARKWRTDYRETLLVRAAGPVVPSRMRPGASGAPDADARCIGVHESPREPRRCSHAIRAQRRLPAAMASTWSSSGKRPVGFHSVWSAEATIRRGHAARLDAAQNTRITSAGHHADAGPDAGDDAMTRPRSHSLRGRCSRPRGVGPAGVEGWHGVPYGSRCAHARVRDPSRHLGAESARAHRPALQSRIAARGVERARKPSRAPSRRQSDLHRGPPVGEDVEQTAEIADGWLPMFFSPYRRTLRDALAALSQGGTQGSPNIDVAPGPIVILGDDSPDARVREAVLALLVGGWGARQRTSTTSSPAATASRRGRRMIQACTSRKKRRRTAPYPTARRRGIAGRAERADPGPARGVREARVTPHLRSSADEALRAIAEVGL